MTLREDADRIVSDAIAAALPDAAVRRALAAAAFPGRVYLVAVGKAAWQMASAAVEICGDAVCDGIVITKYHYSKGSIPRVRVYEAAHPVPDANSFSATQEVLRLTGHLTADDTVLFLLSGGGSALFEQPLVPLEELQDITGQLLSCGAGITEINTVRKRLSAVKGGKFALHCLPARVYSIVLSDIIGDPLDMIASGPAYPDRSTAEEALAVAAKYRLRLSAHALDLLHAETPKALENVTTVVTGSVTQLCKSAEATCRALGYRPVVLTAHLQCEAREAGRFLSAMAQYHADSPDSLAYIAGGETVVHLTGKGLGGRNQELALGAAEGIAGLAGVAVFSAGSDGSDGPTDAAGGYVDGDTLQKLAAQGIRLTETLQNNDSYHALKAVGGLITTGATGTNVNDLTVLLIKRH